MLINYYNCTQSLFSFRGSIKKRSILHVEVDDVFLNCEKLQKTLAINIYGTFFGDVNEQ